MNELTLEVLVPYLPYGLKINILNYKCDYVGIEYAIANGYYIMNNEFYITYDGGSTGKGVNDFKPILRPLSEAIVPYYKIKPDEEGWKEPNDLFVDYNGNVAIDFKIGGKTISWALIDIQKYMQSLFKDHYDVFGLIEKSLAIDINTLK